MKPGMRWLRLRAVWLLVVPFLVLARPTSSLLLAGAGLVSIGLGIRAWAAGHIRKERELTVSGPYSHTRNPLYLGSLFVGLGVAVAGGRSLFVLLFLAFFVLVYGRTMRQEAVLLEGLFGDEYRRYAAGVPLILPRITPWHGPEGTVARFTLTRWRQNREYEALAGAVAGLAFLAAKMLWF